MKIAIEDFEPTMPTRKCWPHKHWGAIAIVSVLLCVVLILASYTWSSYADIFRFVAFAGVLFVIGCLFRYLCWLIKLRGNSGEISATLKPAGENNPEAWAGAFGRGPSNPVTVVWVFVRVLMIALIVFILFVVIISVPDYLIPNTGNSQDPQIDNLIARETSPSIRDLGPLLLGSTYFCAGNMATAGSGVMTPGFNPWGRLAAIIIFLFDILLFPVVSQYILSNYQLAVALQSIRKR
jgi:hypothetical protein